eukprot:g23790.t1
MKKGGYEYSRATDEGKLLHFWDHINSTSANQRRIDITLQKFMKKYPDHPYLKDPTCDFDPEHTTLPRGQGCPLSPALLVHWLFSRVIFVGMPMLLVSLQVDLCLPYSWMFPQSAMVGLLVCGGCVLISLKFCVMCHCLASQRLAQALVLVLLLASDWISSLHLMDLVTDDAKDSMLLYLLLAAGVVQLKSSLSRLSLRSRWARAWRARRARQMGSELASSMTVESSDSDNEQGHSSLPESFHEALVALLGFNVRQEPSSRQFLCGVRLAVPQNQPPDIPAPTPAPQVAPAPAAPPGGTPASGPTGNPPAARHLLKPVLRGTPNAEGTEPPPPVLLPLEISSEHEKCVVCMEEFQPGDRVRPLPKCAHVFHASCLEQWIMTGNSREATKCPMCRRPALARKQEKGSTKLSELHVEPTVPSGRNSREGRRSQRSDQPGEPRAPRTRRPPRRPNRSQQLAVLSSSLGVSELMAQVALDISGSGPGTAANLLLEHRSVLESDYTRGAGSRSKGRGRGPFPLEDAVPHVVAASPSLVGAEVFLARQLRQIAAQHAHLAMPWMRLSAQAQEEVFRELLLDVQRRVEARAERIQTAGEQHGRESGGQEGADECKAEEMFFGERVDQWQVMPVESFKTLEQERINPYTAPPSKTEGQCTMSLADCQMDVTEPRSELVLAETPDSVVVITDGRRGAELLDHTRLGPQRGLTIDAGPIGLGRACGETFEGSENGDSTQYAEQRKLQQMEAVPSVHWRAELDLLDGLVRGATQQHGAAAAAKAPPPCYVRCASSLVENSTFISLTTLLTIYALTGDDFRIIFTQKPADEYFNAMVLICIAIFSFEIIISVMGKSDYWLGFFFILDVVSTVTLVLDLTWINDLLAGNGDSSSLRSGRTARIGAKAARMIRVLRLVRILKLYKAWHEADRERARRRREAAMRASRPDDDEWDEHDDEALADAEENEEKEAGQESTLGKKLSEMTTRRVIILILAMLLILPLLQVDDFTQAPFSAEYGADQVMESFKDWDASGSSSDRVRYQNSMLTYVYYHNWYAGKGFWQYCPYSQVPSCSNGFWGHLYFVGIRGSNLAEVAAKASKARLNLTVVESFDEASKARDQAVYNLGSLPSQAQEWLAAAWTNDCPIISQNLEYLKGVSIIAEEGEGVYYPVTCPQD